MKNVDNGYGPFPSKQDKKGSLLLANKDFDREMLVMQTVSILKFCFIILTGTKSLHDSKSKLQFC